MIGYDTKINFIEKNPTLIYYYFEEIMPHFFINSGLIENNSIKVNDNELLNHLVKSLRVKEGEKLKDKVIDGNYSLIFGNEASGLDDSYLNVGTPLIIKHNKTNGSLNIIAIIIIPISIITQTIGQVMLAILAFIIE